MKVKVGLDPVTDMARVRAVREVCGQNIPVTIDANCGWTIQQARHCLRELADVNLLLAEQPEERMPGFVKQKIGVIDEKNETRLAVKDRAEEQPDAEAEREQFRERHDFPFCWRFHKHGRLGRRWKNNHASVNLRFNSEVGGFCVSRLIRYQPHLAKTRNQFACRCGELLGDTFLGRLVRPTGDMGVIEISRKRSSLDTEVLLNRLTSQNIRPPV